MTEAIRATLRNINRVVAENQQTVTNSLHNVETFTATLARNSERIDAIMGKIDAVMGKADGVVAKTDNIMLGLDTLAGGKDGGELFQAVKSIRELAEDFDRRSGR